MQLVCNRCQYPFQAADLRESMGVAICASCGSIEKLELRKREKALVAQPARFEVDDSYDLSVRWRWFEPQYIFMAFFCIAWDGFLVMWYSIGLSRLGKPDGSALMLLFPLLHVATGVVLTYRTLAGFLNSSLVTLSNGALQIDHRPLWWPGRKQIEGASLKQLYVAERTGRRKGGTYTKYELMALDQKGNAISLIGNLKTVEEGKFLERRLEEKLNIKDQPVAGEVS